MKLLFRGPLESFDLLTKKSSRSLSDTKAMADNLSSLLKPGMVVGFAGELGVGKTELIRAICEKFGNIEQVSSPSYTLENQYKLSRESLLSPSIISHWDLYRLASLGEIGNELEELKLSEKALILIEWPNLVMDLLDLLVLISFADFEGREICIYARKSLNFSSF